jgi:hypothetical protein
MIDNQFGTETPAQQARTIPIHERSVLVGIVIVVNGYRANRTLLSRSSGTDHRLPCTSLPECFLPKPTNAENGTGPCASSFREALPRHSPKRHRQSSTTLELEGASALAGRDLPSHLLSSPRYAKVFSASSAICSTILPRP